MCQKWSNAILYSYRYFTRAFLYFFFFFLLTPQLPWHGVSFQKKGKYTNYFVFMLLDSSSLCVPYSGFMSNFLKIRWCLYISFVLDSVLKIPVLQLDNITVLWNTVAFSVCVCMYYLYSPHSPAINIYLV